jgi:hypothetical protein
MSQSNEAGRNTCISCKKPEGADVVGASYVSNGDNGMIVAFWMCDACAIKLSPDQGPIDMDEERPAEATPES